MSSGRGARTAESKRLNSRGAWTLTLGVSSVRTLRQAAGHPLRDFQRTRRQPLRGLLGHAREDRSTIAPERLDHPYRTRMPRVPRIENFTRFGTMGFGCRLVQRVTSSHGVRAGRARPATEDLRIPYSANSASDSRRPRRASAIGVGWTPSRVTHSRLRAPDPIFAHDNQPA